MVMTIKLGRETFVSQNEGPGSYAMHNRAADLPRPKHSGQVRAFSYKGSERHQ
jgi:hypothetical protein